MVLVGVRIRRPYATAGALASMQLDESGGAVARPQYRASHPDGL